MKAKNIDEQPDNAPILMTGVPMRVRGSSPIRFRKLAWAIRQRPRDAAASRYFLIKPDGWSNARRSGAA